MTPLKLIARENEIQEIQSVWQAFLAQKTRFALLLTGAPGSGKNSLVRHFLELARNSGESPFFFEFAFSESLSKNLSLPAAPDIFIKEFLAQSLHLELTDPDLKEKLTQSMQGLFEEPTLSELLYFLGGYIGLAYEPNPLISAISEEKEELKKLSDAALRSFVERLAEQHPVFFSLFNLHWCSEDTLNLLKYLIEATKSKNIFFLLTASDSLDKSVLNWLQLLENHKVIGLVPFNSDETEVFLQEYFQPAVKIIPNKLTTTLFDLSKGNPKIILDTLAVFKERGIIVQTGEKYEFHLEKLTSQAMKSTLDEAIKSRIETLSQEEIHLLKKAAVMGQTFWFNGLMVLYKSDPHYLKDDIWIDEKARWVDDQLVNHVKVLIDSLISKEIVSAVPNPLLKDELEYAFVGESERNRIYQTLPPEEKIKYHALFAQWLEYISGDQLNENLEAIATHYELGGNLYKAGYYFIHSANFARSHYAFNKAMLLYLKGMKYIDVSDCLTKIEVYHHMGTLFVLSGNYKEGLAYFRKMLQLAWVLNNKNKGGAAHNRIGRIYRDMGEFYQAMEHMMIGQFLFNDVNDQRGVASSYDDIGKIYWYLGEYDKALAHYQKGLDIRRTLHDKRSIALSLYNLGYVQMETGDLKSAIDNMNEALTLRREIQDKEGIAFSLIGSAEILIERGESAEAKKALLEAIKIANAIGDKLIISMVQIAYAKYYVSTSTFEKAKELLEHSVAHAEGLNEKWVLAELYNLLAFVLLQLKHYDKALEIAQESLTLSKKIDSKACLGTSYYTLGQIYASIVFEASQLVPDLFPDDPDPLKKATLYFKQGYSILEEIGNLIQLSKCIALYSEFLFNKGEEKAGEEIQEKGAELIMKIRGAIE